MKLAAPKFLGVFIDNRLTWEKHIHHDGVIKWKHFPCYWPFVWGIHRSPVKSPQRPVTRRFDVFFDLCPNKRLSKQWWGWWFETPSCPLWRHCDGIFRVKCPKLLVSLSEQTVFLIQMLWKLCIIHSYTTIIHTIITCGEIRVCLVWIHACHYRMIRIITYDKNIERHTADTIVSWPNPKQWVIVGS